MKKIKFEEIRKGNYICAENNLKSPERSSDWIFTYFKVIGREKGELKVDFSLDFNNNDKFLIIDVLNLSIGLGFKYFKLTKKEYHNKFDKYLMLQELSK